MVSSRRLARSLFRRLPDRGVQWRSSEFRLAAAPALICPTEQSLAHVHRRESCVCFLRECSQHLSKLHLSCCQLSSFSSTSSSASCCTLLLPPLLLFPCRYLSEVVIAFSPTKCFPSHPTLQMGQFRFRCIRKKLAVQISCSRQGHWRFGHRSPYR